ncbi:sulfite oxidase [Niveomyces insectorum RCEF 264]|uniref:Nitrate reductase [NADPH] n=1 Tax=Niveomyces insectorum RCEF 264 TaxID=1081102 RepID=A0A167MZT6_9HYPO|nr:sulfite oxidase [Niveomyces insectorum RCEF 264]
MRTFVAMRTVVEWCRLSANCSRRPIPAVFATRCGAAAAFSSWASPLSQKPTTSRSQNVRAQVPTCKCDAFVQPTPSRTVRAFSAGRVYRYPFESAKGTSKTQDGPEERGAETGTRALARARARARAQHDQAGGTQARRGRDEDRNSRRNRRKPDSARLTLYAGVGLLSVLLVVSQPLRLSSVYAGVSEPDRGTDPKPDPEHNGIRTGDDTSGLAAATTTTTADGDGRDPSLPRYRLADIRRHDARSGAPWVTSGDKVYDITDWVPAHPGGDVILRAAGHSIDPYWAIFTIHQAPHVREILDSYLIGLVDAADLVDAHGAGAAVDDPFAQDPVRDPRLLVHTAKPCNAETPCTDLARDFLTPNPLFYVRNHMWVPVDDADADANDNANDNDNERKGQADKAYRLTVELPDGAVRAYTLDELRRRFPVHRVTAVLQCSGNRRSDMARAVAPTNGLPWRAGAIGNAVWEGAAWAIDRRGPSRRAPAGVRDPQAWQAAHFPRNKNDNNDNNDNNNKNNTALPVAVTGYAYSGGGRSIIRVDVSVDGGRTWDQAELLDRKTAPGDSPEERTGRHMVARGRRDWAWTRWRYAGVLYNLDRDPIHNNNNQEHDGGASTGCAEIIVKATDSACNTQPERHDSIFNVRGNLANAWHRVRVCPAAAHGGGAKPTNTGSADAVCVQGCGFDETDKKP